jgi:hypothetical protein
MATKITLSLIALFLIFAPNAKATSYDLTATGAGTTINLYLTGTLASPGVFDVTGLTGTVDGYAATLLPTSGPGVITNNFTGSIETTYNNVLYLTQPYFDDNGLAFTADGVIGNLYYSGGYIYSSLGANPAVLELVSVKLVNAPEPGSLILLFAGATLLGLLLLVRK